MIWFGPALAQETAGQSSAAQPQYLLGSGDRVLVTVYDESDLSGQFEVDGTGLISLPLVGAVRIGGKDLAEAESAIIKALKPDYLINPRVSLQVLNYRPFYIMGEIRSPGSYAYRNGITILEAVVIAGGFTYRAKRGGIQIIRGMDATRQKQDATSESIVLPGDVIEVPEAMF
jgi:polysaccharide export outer membrane protein